MTNSYSKIIVYTRVLYDYSILCEKYFNDTLIILGTPGRMTKENADTGDGTMGLAYLGSFTLFSDFGYSRNVY